MRQVKHCLALGAYINGQDQDCGTGTARCKLREGRVAGLDTRCEGAARSKVCSWCSKFIMFCHGISIQFLGGLALAQSARFCCECSRPGKHRESGCSR
jgi:hypothetical protein